MWTRESLLELIQQELGDRLFIVVSNREPYIHTFSEQGIRCEMTASGLTTALDPVMRASGGTWVVHGSGNADREVVDERDGVAVPPWDPKYRLRRVWLTKEEEQGYYHGFSNEAIWPLCHLSYTRPVFEEQYWEAYKKVNQLFAEAVLQEMAGRKAFVFIQDYHLALLSRLIKAVSPHILTAQFWHIPWPNPEAFRVCPWQDEILEGLLGNDLLGFHIQDHCNNFLETIERSLEARVDRDRFEVTYKGKRTVIRPFPISIDFEEISQTAQGADDDMQRLAAQLGLGDVRVGLGIDRTDYTKGIPERLKALDRFLEKYPKYHGKLVLIQVGVPSRTDITAYKALNEEIDRVVEGINTRYGSSTWKPVIYIKRYLPFTEVVALMRLADFLIVSSLHDGMNLVAKEFVSSRYDEDGVLMLSPFTGAARELTDSVIVNPYATDHMAEALKMALEMPRKEKRFRMSHMRRIVQENNIYKWAAEVVTEILKLRPREG